MKTIRIQLGNPGDTSGAVFAEGVILGSIDDLGVCSSEMLFVGVVIDDAVFVADAHRVSDLNPQMGYCWDGVEAYSTAALPFNRFPLFNRMSMDAEKKIRECFKELGRVK